MKTHPLEDATMGAFINDLRNDVIGLVADRLDSALSQEMKLKTVTAGIMMGLLTALFTMEKDAAERAILRDFIRLGIDPCADAAIDRINNLFDKKAKGPLQ